MHLAICEPGLLHSLSGFEHRRVPGLPRVQSHVQCFGATYGSAGFKSRSTRLRDGTPHDLKIDLQSKPEGPLSTPHPTFSNLRSRPSLPCPLTPSQTPHRNLPPRHRWSPGAHHKPRACSWPRSGARALIAVFWVRISGCFGVPRLEGLMGLVTLVLGELWASRSSG